MSATEIVTKDEVFEYLKRFPLVGNRDDKIRLGVNAFIETYCGRVFAKADAITEKHSVMDRGSYSLMVRNPPIRALTSVSYGTTPLSVLDPTYYYIEDADIGLLGFEHELYVGHHGNTILYDGGFATIPDDLKLTALSIIARESEKVEKGRHGMKTRIFTMGTFEMVNNDLEFFEKSTLNNYKLMRFL